MIVVSSGAFVVTRMLYGDQGSETGALDFLLYGLVGLVPAMLCSWLLNEASNGGIQRQNAKWRKRSEGSTISGMIGDLLQLDEARTS